MMDAPRQTLIGPAGLKGIRGVPDFSPSRPAKFLLGERLVVGGGAGGSTANSSATINGGAGGGGVSIEALRLYRGTYTITVGAGGAVNSNGAPSAIDRSDLGNIVTVLGGGRGGRRLTSAASDGGSGGGGAGGDSATAPTGVAVDQRYGFDGCRGNATGNGSGGGGAGGPGGLYASTVGGAGGVALVSDFTGASTSYGAGSGANGFFQASAIQTTAGASGVNAGASTSTNTTAGAGVANTGGAGGCGGWNVDSASGGAGGAGGSGIVAIRYRGDVQLCQGGTVTFANGWCIHTFTSSGSFVVP